jgi:hypothetical protein
MDIYYSPWKKLDGLINSGRLFAPREVFDEIDQFDDTLTDWTRKNQKMFVEPTEVQIEIVREILKTYPSFLKNGKRFAADPWVIALAVEMIRNPQKILVEVKRIVVTEEKIRGNRIKIPYVCQEYNITAIDILDMFRNEGWRF